MTLRLSRFSLPKGQAWKFALEGTESNFLYYLITSRNAGPMTAALSLTLTAKFQVDNIALRFGMLKDPHYQKSISCILDGYVLYFIPGRIAHPCSCIIREAISEHAAGSEWTPCPAIAKTITGKLDKF